MVQFLGKFLLLKVVLQICFWCLFLLGEMMKFDYCYIFFQAGSIDQLVFVELRSETEKAGKFPIDHMIISVPYIEMFPTPFLSRKHDIFLRLGGVLSGKECSKPPLRQPYKVGYKWGEMGKWSKMNRFFCGNFTALTTGFWGAHLVTYLIFSPKKGNSWLKRSRRKDIRWAPICCK